jgi:beta-lactamase hcpA
MESCLKAAFQYEDDDKKLKLVKKACDSGNKLDCLTTQGLSCAISAKRYVKGYGVKMGVTKAAVYYKKGCDLVGELLGCYNFAIFNHHVEKDKNKAAKYYKKACDSGKDSPFINPSPKFKETRQKSRDMYELLK